jgi:hypothetical protein
MQVWIVENRFKFQGVETDWFPMNVQVCKSQDAATMCMDRMKQTGVAGEFRVVRYERVEE